MSKTSPIWPTGLQGVELRIRGDGVHRRFDDPRRDGVHPNTAPCILDRERLVPVRSASETAESAKRVGSCRSGPGHCRLWRGLVPAASRHSRPASQSDRRAALDRPSAINLRSSHRRNFANVHPASRSFSDVALSRPRLSNAACVRFTLLGSLSSVGSALVQMARSDLLR
jgi:hypothetical protein